MQQSRHYSHHCHAPTSRHASTGQLRLAFDVQLHQRERQEQGNTGMSQMLENELHASPSQITLAVERLLFGL